MLFGGFFILNSDEPMKQCFKTAKFLYVISIYKEREKSYACYVMNDLHTRLTGKLRSITIFPYSPPPSPPPPSIRTKNMDLNVSSYIRIHGPTKGNERIMACKRMLSFSGGSHNGWGGKGTGLLDLMMY
jgi:hypothetical protein